MPGTQDPKAFATMVFDGRYKLARYHSSDEGSCTICKAIPAR